MAIFFNHREYQADGAFLWVRGKPGWRACLPGNESRRQILEGLHDHLLPTRGSTRQGWGRVACSGGRRRTTIFKDPWSRALNKRGDWRQILRVGDYYNRFQFRVFRGKRLAWYFRTTRDIRTTRDGRRLRCHRDHGVSTHQGGPLGANTADGSREGLGRNYHQGCRWTPWSASCHY